MLPDTMRQAQQRLVTYQPPKQPVAPVTYQAQNFARQQQRSWWDIMNWALQRQMTMPLAGGGLAPTPAIGAAVGTPAGQAGTMATAAQQRRQAGTPNVWDRAAQATPNAYANDWLRRQEWQRQNAMMRAGMAQPNGYAGEMTMIPGAGPSGGTINVQNLLAGYNQFPQPAQPAQPTQDPNGNYGYGGYGGGGAPASPDLPRWYYGLINWRYR